MAGIVPDCGRTRCKKKTTKLHKSTPPSKINANYANEADVFEPKICPGAGQEFEYGRGDLEKKRLLAGCTCHPRNWGPCPCGKMKTSLKDVVLTKSMPRGKEYTVGHLRLGKLWVGLVRAHRALSSVWRSFTESNRVSNCERTGGSNHHLIKKKNEGSAVTKKWCCNKSFEISRRD